MHGLLIPILPKSSIVITVISLSLYEKEMRREDILTLCKLIIHTLSFIYVVNGCLKTLVENRWLQRSQPQWNQQLVYVAPTVDQTPHGGRPGFLWTRQKKKKTSLSKRD